MVGLKVYENRYGEVRLRRRLLRNSNPDFPRRKGYVDEVRYDGIQLHLVIPRTPWLVAVRALCQTTVCQPTERT